MVTVHPSAYSLLLLKMDIQKAAGTLMATGKTGFLECTLLGGDGSKFRTKNGSKAD